MNLLADVLVGLPAGFLIFMSTVMFNALLQAAGLSAPLLGWINLPLLALDALIVGALAALSRRRRALQTAAAAGSVAGLILLGLRLSVQPASHFDPGLFGPAGILTALLFPLLGSWLVLRRKGRAS